MSVAPVGGPSATAVRRAGTEAAAAGFERILLEQLTKSLVDSAMGERSGPYAALLPETLADAIGGRPAR